MVIDAIGPVAASWLPPRIPLSETMAIAVARLWLISPHRDAAMRATRAHLRSASDVLRVAIVLMGGSPSLASPTRLRSLGRALRRAVLDVLEQLPLEDVIENMRRHRALWKRVGERLHPFERAHELPNTTLAFATLRGTDIATTSFAEKLHEQATHLPFVYLEDGRVRTIAWAAPIEEALRAGNPRSALARLTHRSGELLRRADHLVRIAQTRQLDALQTCVKAIELAAVKGPPAAMLMLASHVARRGRPWSRRVFFAAGQPLRAWTAPDARRPLRGDAIAVIVGAIRRQLVTRAENKRQFPRAVLDRTLGELSLPLDESPRAQRSVVWPRSSELAIPEGQLVRVFVHGGTLAVELFDDNWRHHASCDAAHPVLGDDAATYVVSSSAQLVELHGEKLYARGAQHVVLTVRGTQPMFAGLLAEGQAFDPHAAAMRFDLPRRGTLAVALTIDLGERRLRWVDLPIRRADLDRVGGYRAALAHLGRAFADLGAAGARPTMWDLACIHASARANVIYVRERDGSYTMYRRRDNESRVGRLGRLLSGAADDGKLPTIPTVDAPTWFALVTGIGLPAGSIGYALDPGGLSPDVVRLAAGDLLAELALP
jgi:hypothetical protein